ncbi:MAG: putative baseplate assembly protein [Burkholderiaceae bacterium]
MPLPEPSLDNRVFDQLVAEGRGMVPRLASNWTDHNASDPGITLIELMAWMAEQNIYRFDRESDESARTFVRLVGIEPQPLAVARTVVSVGGTGGVVLPERSVIAAGAEPLFETTEPLFASPARLISVYAGRTAYVDDTAANAQRSAFDAFGPRPRVEAALYLGFDLPLDAAGRTLSLYVWTAGWRGDEAVRAALIAEAAATAPGCPRPDWRLHYRVRTVWEFRTGGDRWQPLAGVVDETRALSLSGFVRFEAPIGHQPGGPGPQYFIRCRIVGGRFECPPRIVHVAVNAVGAEHALSRPERSIGRSRGQAGAVFPLREAPVVPGSLTLRLDDGAGHVETDWQAASDWDRAAPHDHVFGFTPETGEIVSGNGLRGAMLPAGFDLLAAWRTGGGSAGNLAADTLDTLPATPALALSQPFAAVGGAPAETLAQSRARAYDRVDTVDKAVTLADIEHLALAAPGVPVARVRAVANMAPRLPCWTAPGVVTLIVIPPCPLPAPMPSAALLAAVERYLEPRRLVSCEIRAIAPRYRLVSVSATLHLSCDADAAAVLRTAAARIDAFFDPLTGGPAGQGWPFGRTVYRSEVMALLADTPGVARVGAFGLRTPADAGPRCNNVELCTHELVRPGSHDLRARADVPIALTRSLAHDCHAHR